mmetsp:Transcript_78823/g.174497  ORF Transcript_78823/g.174497 Transcript_78823/m.174497 type:complete len:251 (+) Transcript_78823:188-940(+)
MKGALAFITSIVGEPLAENPQEVQEDPAQHDPARGEFPSGAPQHWEFRRLPYEMQPQSDCQLHINALSVQGGESDILTLAACIFVRASALHGGLTHPNIRQATLDLCAGLPSTQESSATMHPGPLAEATVVSELAIHVGRLGGQGLKLTKGGQMQQCQRLLGTGCVGSPLGQGTKLGLDPIEDLLRGVVVIQAPEHRRPRTGEEVTACGKEQRTCRPSADPTLWRIGLAKRLPVHEPAVGLAVVAHVATA